MAGTVGKELFRTLARLKTRSGVSLSEAGPQGQFRKG
jgi:hypothetical protein